MVKEKSAQGGGLVPLTVGEDHVPEGVQLLLEIYTQHRK